MCGITGFVDYEKRYDPGACIEDMTGALAHRGPDGAGVRVFDKGRCSVALGHRRLAVIDLSQNGSQPMSCGKSTIVYNGEIYNFRQIRQELSGEGCAFFSETDTEVLLRAIDKHGIKVVNKLRGMFSFALFDENERVIYLVRDRMGEKPLYYGWNGEVFFFASELKAMRKHPGFAPEVNRQALRSMIKYKYIHSPASIYEGIKKLPPGHVYKFFIDDPRKSFLMEYWSIEKEMEAGRKNPFKGSDDEARRRIECILKDAVSGQMYADVPLGAFLSGGVDSSLIVSMMKETGHDAIKTFSIGFTDREYDEAPHAKQVADYLGVEHTEKYFTARDLMEIIYRLPVIYDEPFADPAQLPAILLAFTAREKVTVALSGDGGDELFCGYERYRTAKRIWALGGKIPFKKGLSRQAEYAAAGIQRIMERFPHRVKRRMTRDRMTRMVRAFLSDSPQKLYDMLVSNTVFYDDIVPGAGLKAESLYDLEGPAWEDVYRDSARADMTSFLTDDILVKVDRAAMNASLETRMPFLDHDLVEFSARIPSGIKVKGNRMKDPLKQMLYERVPRSIAQRPKKGFAVPISKWLRGSLKPWADGLIYGDHMRTGGYLDHKEVRMIWESHQKGFDHSACLWNILMFQGWAEHNGL
jgi:asparagine synthase (glutamine-hydrolysing)